MSSTDDKRKGFDKLKLALKSFLAKQDHNNVEFVVFGNKNPDFTIDLGLPTRYIGNIHLEDDLISLYSAADVFVAPSLQDNLPNTIMESMACGTPVISFNIGGIPDMVDHKINGYLANSSDIDDLATGIDWILKENHRWQQLSRNARLKIVRSFDLSIVSQKYLSLYQSILTNTKHSDRNN